MNDSRVLFNGITYRLKSLSRTDTRLMLSALKTLDHLGSVRKQELQGDTLQVYQEALGKKNFDGTVNIVTIRFYAVRAYQSNFVNEIYMMEAFDYIPAPVPAL